MQKSLPGTFNGRRHDEIEKPSRCLCRLLNVKNCRNSLLQYEIVWSGWYELLSRICLTLGRSLSHSVQAVRHQLLLPPSYDGKWAQWASCAGGVCLRKFHLPHAIQRIYGPTATLAYVEGGGQEKVADRKAKGLVFFSSERRGSENTRSWI